MFMVPQGQFRFNVLPMGMKPSSDYFNPATKMLEEEAQGDHMIIMDNVAGGAATSSKIKEKAKLRVSRTIEVGGFKTTTPQIKPTKKALNKILDFPVPQIKEEVQWYIGLINTVHHWTHKMNANCPNLRFLVGSKTYCTWNEKLQEEFNTT